MNNSKPLVKKLIPIIIAATSVATITGCSLDGHPTAAVTPATVIPPTVIDPVAQEEATDITVMDGYLTDCIVTDSSDPVLTAIELTPTVDGVIGASPGVYRFPLGSEPTTPVTSAGCIDSASGLTIPTLRTPIRPGQTQVTATFLAALIQARIEAAEAAGTTLSLDDATTEIATGMGLPTDIDITTYDPIAELSNADDPSDAAAIQAANVQVAVLLDAIESTGAGTADDALDAIATAASDAAADTTGTTTVDLSDSGTVNDIISGSTSGAVSPGEATDIADAVSAINTVVDTAVQSISDASTDQDELDFLVDLTAATIVVDGMSTAIEETVAPGSSTTLDDALVNIDTTLDAAADTVELDGLTSDPVEPEILCSDNETIVSDVALCPTLYLCADGETQVTDINDCVTLYLCPDGETQVENEDNCPVVTGATN